MGIVDKVMSGLHDKQARDAIHQENANRRDDGPAALALGKPAEYIVDDRIGGTHTRNVKDAVVHENVIQHAHHEVTPIVDREREETEIHQKVQPVVDQQELHTHHQHVAPQVSRNVQEDIDDEAARRYRSQGQYTNQQSIGDQTHSTSVNAPIVREHVNKHIIEEIQPVIQRQTQRVEHHHTTQQINEVHVKAPVVHSVVHAPAITMAEFTGKVAELGKGSLGHSHSTSTGSTGSHGISTGAAGGIGSRGVGSGLTGTNHHTNLNSNNTSSGVYQTDSKVAGRRRSGSSSSSSSASSSDVSTNGTRTRRSRSGRVKTGPRKNRNRTQNQNKEGIIDKVKHAVTGNTSHDNNAAYNNNTTTTTTSNSNRY